MRIGGRMLNLSLGPNANCPWAQMRIGPWSLLGGPGGWIGSNIDLRCSSAANRALLDHFEGVSDDIPTILPTISTFPQEQEQGGKRVHTVLLSR